MMSLAEGTRLGRYEIRRAVGAGGMGEVYEAIDTRLDRLVAVKVLPADRAADEDARARFDREARAIAALNHPNICALYDVGQSDGHDYLVMELVEGETLQQRLSRGPFDFPALVDLALPIVDALDTAHGRGLIHRDLKPANIFITTRGVPKVLDFGLAKTFEDREPDVTRAREADLTGLGATLGTVAYMSPEQLRAEPLDGRTDLFSLGLVLYEMATGRGAFGGTTSVVVAAAILNETPQAPRTHRPDLPVGFDDVLLKALHKDRNRRYQTAADLRNDLARLARPSSSHAVTVVDRPADVVVASSHAESGARANTTSRSRSHGLLLAGLGVMAAVAVVAGAMVFMGRDSAPPPTPATSAPVVPPAADPPAASTPPPPPVPVPSQEPQREAAPQAARAEQPPAAEPPGAGTAAPGPGADEASAGRGEAARGGRGRAGRGGALAGLAASLRGLPPQSYDLVVQADDAEAREMAAGLRNALDVSGWTCVSTRELPVPQEGIAVVVPAASPGATALVNWARRGGYAPVFRTMPGLPRMRIVIAGRREPGI